MVENIIQQLETIIDASKGTCWRGRDRIKQSLVDCNVLCMVVFFFFFPLSASSKAFSGCCLDTGLGEQKWIYLHERQTKR